MDPRSRSMAALVGPALDRLGFTLAAVALALGPLLVTSPALAAPSSTSTSDPTTPEATTPEATTPESPETPTPQGPSPESPTPETARPDSPSPDSPTPESPSPDSSTPESTTSTAPAGPPGDPAAPPTGEVPPATTAPTGPPDGEPVTTTTTPVADPADGDGSTEGETTTTDPLINEGPGEDAPDTDETVPPPDGAYAGQEAFEPAEVLWSSVRAAEVKLADALAVEEGLITAVRAIRIEHKQLRAEQASLDDEAQDAAADVRRAETALRERAVAAFVSDDSLNNAIVGSFDAADHDTVLDLQVRRRLLGAALDQDEDAIAAYLELRASLDTHALALLDALRLTERSLQSAVTEVEEARERVEQADNELEAFRAGSALYIDDVVFPVAEGYGRPLIDSFGFPRMPGTPDEHWHEGIDIFAPAGTPLLAAERAVVTRVGSGRLGGLTVWLRGESGTAWYYAHLQSHAPDLGPGLVVEAGHVIGFVGNTGNAISTPPHLHLEIHPEGAGPVNPYPLLKVISDRDHLRG